MKKFLPLWFTFFSFAAAAQDYSVELNTNWQFSKAGSNKWYKAVVPGTVHTDLFRNKLIPDPFFADNEKRLGWIDSTDWVYRSFFTRLSEPGEVYVYFKGLDTYADVFVNGRLLLRSDNMFYPVQADIGQYCKPGKNEIRIIFCNAQFRIDSIAKTKLPLRYPDHNRVFIRKAQYQFGWDWGPKYIGCGIWKPVSLYAYNGPQVERAIENVNPVATLIQQKDSIGESFYFEKNGKPIYIKGANWIPADIFLPNVKKTDYRKLLLRAKNANMNMLRVWGGGVYEDDYFYNLCDSLGIMVWQDFMFAGGMYPADEAFLKNVKAEVKYQVNRLKEHPSVVLWCGNNEIDEAWHHWGWQNQFNLHGTDSAKIWEEYKILFEDSLRAWVNEFDGIRPYISSSPKYGWGNPKSYTNGDSHYWGLWWGLEPWEAFATHTGRFVSEYGMQSMSNYQTLKKYMPADELRYNSPAIQWHQKANEGFKKLNFYLEKYFIDSVKLRKLSLEEYTYLTQCLQYYILKNSIAIHRSKAPQNMGTLLWQLNDCWPGTTWSITDYSRAPKAAWYAVREAYRDDVTPTQEKFYPKDLSLSQSGFTLTRTGDGGFYITASVDLKYVYVRINTREEEEFNENYFDLKKGERKFIGYAGFNKILSIADFNSLKILTLNDIVNKYIAVK